MRLTHLGRLPIVKLNSAKGAIEVSEKLVKSLETKVDNLIELSTELKLENQALKKRLSDLQHEKRDLLERHRQAGDLIDQSINRLQTLENNS
jgi:cell division protein ZapB